MLFGDPDHLVTVVVAAAEHVTREAARPDQPKSVRDRLVMVPRSVFGQSGRPRPPRIVEVINAPPTSSDSADNSCPASASSPKQKAAPADLSLTQTAELERERAS
jgi:hypothetical protein